MKMFSRSILRDKESDRENLDLDLWEKTFLKESPQTIRNIGRIDQIEAKQADLEQRLENILAHFQSSQWTSSKPSSRIRSLSWQELSDMPDVTFELEDGLKVWLQAATRKEAMQVVFKKFTFAYDQKLSKITKLFADLEEDFDDVARRIARCAILEEELAALENSLEGEETEHLGWCVSLIRDVLDYNYAEDLTQAHLELLKKSIDLVHDKGTDCDKEDYQNLHKEFLQTGLALLPTTQKAVDKYGD